MKVDVQTLGTFNRLAHEGAEQAAVSLNQLAGVDSTVEATTIDLATRHDVVSDVRGRDLVGVTIGFSEGLVGDAIRRGGTSGVSVPERGRPVPGARRGRRTGFSDTATKIRPLGPVLRANRRLFSV